MISGWTQPFPTSRFLRPDEWSARLNRERALDVPPDINLSLIQHNGTFIDIVDRNYRLRGMLLTLFSLVGTGLILLGGTFGVVKGFASRHPDPGEVSLTAILAALTLIFIWLIWHAILSKDFFTSTHYPIRFNRKTRMVHFHRGNKAGVVTVPWDEGFFHIGRGMRETFLNDIRCHVMDGDLVKQTFAIGHYYDDERVVRALWEFIRRYMEDGPDTTELPPHRRYIGLSRRPSLFNCYFFVMASASTSPFIGWALMPLLAPLILCRWLVLNTCSVPRWPEEVERESEVAPDDPHAWPIPRWNGEFIHDMEGPGAKRPKT